MKKWRNLVQLMLFSNEFRVSSFGIVQVLLVIANNTAQRGNRTVNRVQSITGYHGGGKYPHPA